MKYINIVLSDKDKIKEMSSLASKIVKEHYDPILGSTQNDYMIDKFQSVTAITKQLEQGYQYYIVSDNDENEVGFIGYYPRDNEMYLSKFYLLRNQRGKGISREMLDFIITNTKEAGLASIVLNVNKYNVIAIRAYEKIGFVKIRDEKIDIGNGYFMDDYVYQYMIQ